MGRKTSRALALAAAALIAGFLTAQWSAAQSSDPSPSEELVSYDPGALQQFADTATVGLGGRLSRSDGAPVSGVVIGVYVRNNPIPIPFVLQSPELFVARGLTDRRGAFLILIDKKLSHRPLSIRVFGRTKSAGTVPGQELKLYGLVLLRATPATANRIVVPNDFRARHDWEP